MKTTFYHLAIVSTMALVACSGGGEKVAEQPAQHRFAVLAPGHFHAALVSKSSIPAVCDTINVYSPVGDGLDQYLEYIETYNSRADNPTHWATNVHAGSDYMADFDADNTADIVVLAGDNHDKTNNILRAVKSGKNVLADKPMAINPDGFQALIDAYETAGRDSLIICELMTERFDTLNILTREIINDPDGLFGSLVTPLDSNYNPLPSVSMKSVHHFYKEVSGNPLKRPAWYYDVTHQGEGIADVTTHLIDLVLWQCFPNQVIDYKNDVRVLEASHYATVITPEQFLRSTGDTIQAPIEVFSNGSILFSVNDLLFSIEVQWDFEAPEGSGDTFEAVYHGTDCNLIVSQNAGTQFVKQLDYVDATGSHRYDVPLDKRLGHEDHFNSVTNNFLKYLDGEPMPVWEVPNTLAKYYITTEAVRLANDK